MSKPYYESLAWACVDGDHVWPGRAGFGRKCWCGKKRYPWKKANYKPYVMGLDWSKEGCRSYGEEYFLPEEGTLEEVIWFLNEI
jgi:hypothetical protein